MARRLAILAAVLLAVAAGLTLYVRSSPSRADADRRARLDAAAELHARAQAAFSALPTATVADLTSSDDIQALLSTAHEAAPLPPGAGPRDALLAHVAEFLYYRFVQTDPAAYRSWRQAQGYTLIPWPELAEFWRLDEDYQTVTGGPPPPDLTSERAFDAFWAADAEPRPQRLGPLTALAIEPRAIVTAGALYTRAAPIHPRLTTEGVDQGFDPDLWDGRGVIGFSRWYSSRHRPAALTDTWMTAEHPVPFAHVAIIARFSDGSFVPIRVMCAWDQARAAWSIEAMTMASIPTQRAGSKAF